jgi:hypothetical protein
MNAVEAALHGMVAAGIDPSMPQMSREAAVQIAEMKAWQSLSERDCCMLQLCQTRLFMDFSEFHRMVEEQVGGPVWTHEFGSRENTRKWFELIRDGNKIEPPTAERLFSFLK